MVNYCVKGAVGSLDSQKIVQGLSTGGGTVHSLGREGNSNSKCDNVCHPRSSPDDHAQIPPEKMLVHSLDFARLISTRHGL